MPKELPRPLSSTKSSTRHGEIATRHRQRANALKRQRRSDQRATRDRTLESVIPQPYKSSTESRNRLTLTLFDSTLTWDSFLPCASLVGPFSFVSSFKRVSRGLKPFVRLPLRSTDTPKQQTPDHFMPPSSNPSQPSKASTERDLPTRRLSDDMAVLSPMPWTPLAQDANSTSSMPKRSSTLISTSSTGTRHMSMFDMYQSGLLTSKHRLSVHGSPHGIIKRKQSDRKRRSTAISRAFVPKRLSSRTSSSGRTYTSARSQFDTQMHSICSSLLQPSRPSTQLVTTTAHAKAFPSLMSQDACDQLLAISTRYDLPSPPPSLPSSSPPPTIFRPQLPRLTMPDPLSGRRGTVDIPTSVSSFESPFDDVKAVLYRQSSNIERRFDNGHWSWSRTELSAPKSLSPAAEPAPASNWRSLFSFNAWRHVSLKLLASMPELRSI